MTQLNLNINNILDDNKTYKLIIDVLHYKTLFYIIDLDKIYFDKEDQISIEDYILWFNKGLCGFFIYDFIYKCKTNKLHNENCIIKINQEFNNIQDDVQDNKLLFYNFLSELDNSVYKYLNKIGFILYKKTEYKTKIEFYIASIIIVNEYQGKGFGTYLLNYFIQTITTSLSKYYNKNIYTTCKIKKNNKLSLRLFKSKNYKIYKEVDNWYYLYNILHKITNDDIINDDIINNANA